MLFYTVLRILPLRAVRRAYHSLEESEKKYRSLYESMKEGVALHRIDYDEYGVPVSFTIVDVNPSCQLLLGLSSEELIGKDGSELFGGAVAGYFRRFSVPPPPARHFPSILSSRQISSVFMWLSFFPRPGISPFSWRM